MRFPNIVKVLLLAGLAVGCAAPGAPATSAPNPGHVAPPKAPASASERGVTPYPDATPLTPTPPTPQVVDSTSHGESPTSSPICGPIESRTEFVQRFHEREQFVMDTLKAAVKDVSPEAVPSTLIRTADCLQVEPVESDLFVVSTPRDQGVQVRIALWRRNGAWYSASLSVFPNGLYPQVVRKIPGAFDVLALFRVEGTGRFGAYYLLRFSDDMTILSQSETYGQFGALLFNDQWVFGTYRDPAVWKEVPWGANCCLPRDGQVLWKWEGDALVEMGTRIFPDPERTVTAFEAAWRQGKPELLIPWVTDAAALKAMMDEAGFPSTVTLGPQLSSVSLLMMLEARHWDKLPPDVNGPAPGVTELVWPATPRPLRLKRVGEAWKVAGWGLLKGPVQSELEAILPVSSLDPSTAEQGLYVDLINKKVADANTRLGEPTRVIRTIEGTDMLIYDRLGLMLETWSGEVQRLAQNAGQVVPGIRIGGDTSVVEKLDKLRIYETGQETIYTTHAYGLKYEVHASAGRITRAYVYYSIAAD